MDMIVKKTDVEERDTHIELSTLLININFTSNT